VGGEQQRRLSPLALTVISSRSSLSSGRRLKFFVSSSSARPPTTVGRSGSASTVCILNADSAQQEGYKLAREGCVKRIHAGLFAGCAAR